MSMNATEDARRLERLWSDRFGNEYTERNSASVETAGAYHDALCAQLGVRSVLEVGCNIGLNLTRLDTQSAIDVCGVDINAGALARARERLGRVKVASASLYDLPFCDGSFELVFTCGVLIHVPPSDLDRAMSEIHRISARYVWCGEYSCETRATVAYHGESGALFKCDFGECYRRLFPEMRVRDRGFLAKRDTPFDDVTWWLFER